MGEKTAITISDAAYGRILRSIGGVYDEAMRDVRAAVEGILQKAYWRIGQLIVEGEQQGKGRAAYGERLMERLSADLTAAGRKGFSQSNLKNMRRVYQSFPIRQLTGELTWTHYVMLSAVRDPRQRRVYQTTTVQKSLDTAALKKLLIRDKVLADLPQRTALTIPSTKGANNGAVRLAVSRGFLYLFRVEDKPVIPPAPGRVTLDGGFYNYFYFPVQKEKTPLPGEIIRILPGSNGKFTRPAGTAVNRRHLYTYRALIEKIVDADTLTVAVDSGFGWWTRQRLRLRRIDAPEKGTPAGNRARGFVARRLKRVEHVVIKTYSTDIYDRYLVDVFYMPGETDPEKTAAEGTYLNQELLEAGHARVWQSAAAPRDWTAE